MSCSLRSSREEQPQLLDHQSQGSDLRSWQYRMGSVQSDRYNLDQQIEADPIWSTHQSTTWMSDHNHGVLDQQQN